MKKPEKAGRGRPAWIYLALNLLRMIVELFDRTDDDHFWWWW